MGLYSTIYVGAGIEIPFQKEKSIVYKNTCGCKEHYNGGKYCCDCGNKIEKIETEQEFFLSAEELIGSENFFHNIEGEQMLLMSNFRHGQIEIDVNIPKNIDSDLIFNLIAEFEEKHSKDIKILESKINQKVTVGFYILHDYS